MEPLSLAPCLAAAAILLQTGDSGEFWQETLERPTELVVPSRLSLTNAPTGPKFTSIIDAIRDGDPDGVRRAGGSPIEALAAVMREVRGQRKMMAKLRRFADTSDGSRLSFGLYLDEGLILRTSPDGTVRKLDLDDPATDLRGD